MTLDHDEHAGHGCLQDPAAAAQPHGDPNDQGNPMEAESRAQRYAKALGHPFPLPLGGKWLRRVGAVMDVADAEQAELRAEVERLRDWTDSWARAEAAEAELAALRGRIEALAAWFESQPNWNEWGVHRQIRAALAASPAEDTTPVIPESVWHEWHGDAEPHAEDGA